MESQKAFSIIKGYISRYLAKENQYFIDPQQILSIVREYFTDYFGKENEALIAERLGKTDLSLVSSKSGAEVDARKFIKNCNSFLLEKDNKALEITDKSEIYEGAYQVANNDLDGICNFVTHEDRNTGKLIDVRRGAFVRDFENAEYVETPWELPFTDVLICHELFHAVTQRVVNNSRQSGINRYDGNDLGIMEEMNELLIDSMALEIVKKMHADGIVFNKLAKRSELIFKPLFVSAKLRTIPDGFFRNYKSVLKPAMLTGNFDELHGAFGGKKKFEDVSQGFVDYRT